MANARGRTLPEIPEAAFFEPHGAAGNLSKGEFSDSPSASIRSNVLGWGTEWGITEISL